jgi:P27 family predicted phage terminase small subunit
MAKPGPAPTPTHLRIVRGDRKDRINTKEPKPDKSKQPKMPDWLSDEAKIIWRRTIKQLKSMNMLYEADQDVIVAYVNAVVNYQKATELVDRSGVLIKGRRDGVVKNPAVQIQRDAATLIRMLAGELGLTPSARTRLKAEQSDESTDFLD